MPAGDHTVQLLGVRDPHTAFAAINRAWCRALPDAGLRLVDADPDVLVHHDYSVRFGETELPPARCRVAVRPWDFGPYPRRWVQVVEEQYDELWTFTDWGRACAVEGGLAPERVRVVPLGVDLSAFTTDGPVHELTQRAATTFLFVGAAVHRKGADVAVRAFLEAFDASDDVRLVVKDHTGDVFYRGLSQRDEILEAADRPGAAPVTYLDAYLPQPELAALYRGATALVAPSRAEGWALPVHEAMACGTPAIVPDYGPFRTSCTPDSAVFVRSRRVRLPVQRGFVVNTLGFEEHVETVDICETPIPALAAAMREVAGWSEPRRRQRSRGARAAAARHSWASSAETVAAAVADLVGRSVG